jgi:hypothetical protein
MQDRGSGPAFEDLKIVIGSLRLVTLASHNTRQQIRSLRIIFLQPFFRFLQIFSSHCDGFYGTMRGWTGVADVHDASPAAGRSLCPTHSTNWPAFRKAAKKLGKDNSLGRHELGVHIDHGVAR